MFLITWGMRKGFRWHHRGGGAVCTIREDLNRAVERLDAKNAIRKFGGKYECVGDAKSSKVL